MFLKNQIDLLLTDQYTRKVDGVNLYCNNLFKMIDRFFSNRNKFYLKTCNNSLYKLFILGGFLLTSKSITKSSNTNEMLLLFIQIIGCLDIFFLFANLALCIYDRQGQEKATDFLPPSSNLPQQSSTYENIESNFVLPQGLYLHE